MVVELIEGAVAVGLGLAEGKFLSSKSTKDKADSSKDNGESSKDNEKSSKDNEDMASGFVGATGFPDPSRPSNMKSKEPEDPFITVQIPETDIWDDPPPYTEFDTSITREEKKGSWLKRLAGSSKDKEPKTLGVRMRKSEFIQYFLKDQKTGQYREGTVEPPGGRKQWLQNRVDEFRSGQLDEGAYQVGTYKNYESLGNKNKYTHAIGKGADFFGQPYTPWAGQAIPTPKKSDQQ